MLRIRYQGRSLTGLESPRLQSLLAYLVLHRDAPQSRKHLAFLLWQDSSEQHAHGNLRNLLLKLRKALPAADDYVLAETQTLQWQAGASFTLDVNEFEKAAQTKSFAACHLAWCVAPAESMEKELEGVKQPIVLMRLEGEHDNFRAALEFAVHSEHRESGLRLAAALERFWLIGREPGVVVRVRARPDPYTLASVWADGRRLTFDQAVTFALDKPE